MRRGRGFGYHGRMSEPPDTSPADTPAEKNWLVLLSATEVVGPLSDEELRGYVAAGQIAADARYFRRQPSAQDAGSEADSRRRAAEDAESLREAQAEVRRLRADLEARNIEFEGERQQMAADIAKIRAESVRKDAELSTLAQADARAKESAEAVARAERDAAEARRSASDAERQRDEARLAATAAAKRAEEAERKLESVRARLASLAEDAASLSSLAAESAPSDDPVSGEAVPAALRIVPAVPATADAVVPEVVSSAPNRTATPSDLASLEARAREELERLRGTATSPQWRRRKG